MKVYKWGALCLSGLALFACKEEKVAKPAAVAQQQKVEAPAPLPLVSSKPVTFLQEEKCFANDRCYQLDVQSLETNVDWINQYFQNEARKLLTVNNFELSKEETAKIQAEWDKLPLAELKKTYVADVAALFKDAEYAPYGFSLEYKPRFIAQNQQVAMFTDYFYHYAGGAHGVYATHFTNFDLKTKKVLHIDDVLQPNQRREFKNLLREAYLEYLASMENEQDQDKAEQLLQERLDMGWEAEPTDNFTFTYSGILSSYPPYMLGSYAEGEIQLLIPYERLIDIVKPEFLFNTTKTIISE
ncbi:RsiV family protein [Gallibacterium salpingitidis]|uniref:DUF3298 domain-containing protein n=1 Tax=Gallibacterium salpingitidis TaxID=505341 RepID=A0A1A7P1D2_9PAST|nr:RsiV family protein [Gallibacterium salpingitidis]OBW95640.1 hypothetical protein QS62_02720 [Gallibacterium salpingitidis]